MAEKRSETEKGLQWPGAVPPLPPSPPLSPEVNPLEKSLQQTIRRLDTLSECSVDRQENERMHFYSASLALSNLQVGEFALAWSALRPLSEDERLSADFRNSVKRVRMSLLQAQLDEMQGKTPDKDNLALPLTPLIQEMAEETHRLYTSCIAKRSPPPQV